MKHTEEKWIQKAIRADFRELGELFGLDPVTIRLMVNRGMKSREQIERYLHGSCSELYSPWLFKDMKRAVELIKEEHHGKVAIASDFDCDGIFSAAILKRGLERLGYQCEVFTPERIAEGYGLNQRIIDEAKENDCTMILTCDNGIAAVDEVAYAKQQGLIVVITDHHDVQESVPPADAIVNHKQKDCEYPFKGLCGAGIAYKLVAALYETVGIPKSEAEELLEFVAIATVADVMDLVDENRILVCEGLKRLENTNNIGLQALIEEQGLAGKPLRAYHIGFVLGPCFNASGRLKTVQMSFELLGAENEKEARVMAAELKALNDERKSMTQVGVDQAFEMLDAQDTTRKHILILLLPECHESLVGIIAGRIKERYHRPVIVFTRTEEGVVKGSGRSIPAYNMFERCMECKDLFLRFGGHPMAAGITMKEENLGELEQRLNQTSGLQEEDLCKLVEIDVPMPVGYITERLVHELERLEPLGKGNTKPVFAQAHFHISRMIKRGKTGNVLSLALSSGEGTKMNGVLFGQSEDFEQFITEAFDADTLQKLYRGEENETDVSFTYYPVVNEYNGYRNIEIQIGSYCKSERRLENGNQPMYDC